MPAIERSYARALSVLTATEASIEIASREGIVAESATMAWSATEASCVVTGSAMRGEDAVMAWAATEASIEIALPDAIAAEADSAAVAWSATEASIVVAGVSASADSATMAWSATEASILLEDVAVIADEARVAMRGEHASIVVRPPPDPMRGPANRWILPRRSDPPVMRRKGNYPIHLGALLGQIGDVVRPIQVGDPFAGVAMLGASSRDPHVLVEERNRMRARVAGGPARIGTPVYALDSLHLTLTETASRVGRISGSALGFAEIAFEAAALRSVDEP